MQQSMLLGGKSTYLPEVGGDLGPGESDLVSFMTHFHGFRLEPEILIRLGGIRVAKGRSFIPEFAPVYTENIPQSSTGEGATGVRST